LLLVGVEVVAVLVAVEEPVVLEPQLDMLLLPVQPTRLL
jgi:hypothetical protein